MPGEHAQQAVAAAGEEDGRQIGIGGQAMEGVEPLGVARRRTGRGASGGCRPGTGSKPSRRSAARPRVQRLRVDRAREGGHADPVAGAGGRGESGGGDQERRRSP